VDGDDRTGSFDRGDGEELTGGRRAYAVFVFEGEAGGAGCTVAARPTRVAHASGSGAAIVEAMLMFEAALDRLAQRDARPIADPIVARSTGLAVRPRGQAGTSALRGSAQVIADLRCDALEVAREVAPGEARAVVVVVLIAGGTLGARRTAVADVALTVVARRISNTLAVIARVPQAVDLERYADLAHRLVAGCAFFASGTGVGRSAVAARRADLVVANLPHGARRVAAHHRSGWRAIVPAPADDDHEGDQHNVVEPSRGELDAHRVSVRHALDYKVGLCERSRLSVLIYAALCRRVRRVHGS
jgi:hypothetical protein